MEEMKITLIDIGNSGYVYKGGKFLWFYTKTDPAQIENIIGKLNFPTEVYYIKSAKILDAAGKLFTNYVPDNLSEWDFAIKRTGEDKALTFDEVNNVDSIF